MMRLTWDTQGEFQRLLGTDTYCGICRSIIANGEKTVVHRNCRSCFHRRCWRHTRGLEGIVGNQAGCIRCRSSFHPPAVKGLVYSTFHPDHLFEQSDSGTTTEASQEEGSIPADSDSASHDDYLDSDDNELLEGGEDKEVNEVLEENEQGPEEGGQACEETTLKRKAPTGEEEEEDLDGDGQAKTKRVKVEEDDEDPEKGGQTMKVDALEMNVTEEQALQEMRDFEDGFCTLRPHTEIDTVLRNFHIRPNFENDLVATNANLLLRSVVSPELLVAYAIFHTALTDQYYDHPCSYLKLSDVGPVWVPVTPQTINAVDVPGTLREKILSILTNHEFGLDCPPSRRRLQSLWMAFRPQSSFYRTGRIVSNGPTTGPTITFMPFCIPQILAMLLELRTDRAYQNDSEMGLFESESEYELGYRIEWQRVWEIPDGPDGEFQELEYEGVGGLGGTRVVGHGIWSSWDEEESDGALAGDPDAPEREVDPPPPYESLPVASRSDREGSEDEDELYR